MANAVDGRDYTTLSTADNVLVVAPPETTEPACSELLDAAKPVDSNVLYITVIGSSDVPFDRGFGAASIDAPSLDDRSRGNDSVVVIAGLPDPVDLGLGLTEFLADRDTDERLVICLHSVTALLRSATLERIYRFLAIATAQVRNADAAAHYHLDPTAHDARTVTALEELFDAVVEVDGAGGRRIAKGVASEN